jgi:glutathione reductase (NADPH)
MPQFDFDLFTIGAGSGGVAASRRAASYGARVAICEESRVGGTCVIRGCVPKKLLVYGAQFADAFADAAGFGWTVPAGVSHDWGALIDAKNQEIDRLNALYIKMLRDSRCTLLEGRGVLVDPHTVEVGGRRYTAANILVATGGHPVVPEVPGVEHAITSNEALDLPSLPKKVLIVGGGYVAVEFAGIFNGLGAETAVAIRGEELLNGFDDDLRVSLSMEMKNRGIEIHTRTTITGIEKAGGCFDVTTQLGRTLSVDAVMYATGRRPNTKGLGLEAAGVRLDGDGAVVVDDGPRTSIPHIYAVGDVTDRMNLTPVAIAEGRALVETLFNDNPVTVDYRFVPTAVFSNPPIGSVGLSEAAARRRGPVDIYRARFKPMKNTLSGREERTLMKLVVDRASDRVLGCHMLGPDAPEIVQGLAVALTCGATKAQFDRTIGLHPSAAEEFVTMREKAPEPKAAAAE